MGEVVRLRRADRASGVTARVQVYGVLRSAIVGMELAPGARLSENELAERIGVSRTPIREALARLRDEQLVEIVPQMGTFVAPISVEAVMDAQFVREALECAAVRLAAARAGEDDAAELWGMLDAQRRARDAGDHDAFFLLDEAFHRRLCDMSGRPIAGSLSLRARGHLDRVRRLSLPSDGYLGEMVSEHEAVVSALAGRDADGAAGALGHHLRMVLSRLPRIRAEHPELFAGEGA